jgi:hypothetical protein
MISYHPDESFPHDMSKHTAGFVAAPVDDIHRIAKCMQRFVWSGSIWKNGYRIKKNFLFSDWCVLDFDNPECSLDWAIKYFCDCKHIIGTTKSHQISKNGAAPHDRFRVAIPWSTRIENARDYVHNMAKVIARYEADEACKDEARAFFKCELIVSTADEGFSMDWEPAPPPPEKPKRKIRKHINGDPHIPRDIANELIHGVATNRHRRGYYIARVLRGNGFSLERTVELLMNSPLKEAEHDFERSVRDGWEKGDGK